MLNTGVLLGRRDSDFVAGALPYEVRNPSGVWDSFVPPGERQWSWKADSMACVSYSAINSIETQEKFLTGEQPNYSDRWLAVMSGTTREGNWLYKVADTLRHQGLVLDSDYPNPIEPWTWEDYHKPLTDPLYTQLVKKGYAWLEKWTVSYEWVDVTPENISYHLKHAPLQMVYPNHAVVGINRIEDLQRFYDTYEPYVKDKKLSEFTTALKIVLTLKQKPMLEIVKDNGAYWLVGEKGKMGIADMQTLGFFRLLTSKEREGSTAGIPDKGTAEKSSFAILMKI